LECDSKIESAESQEVGAFRFTTRNERGDRLVDFYRYSRLLADVKSDHNLLIVKCSVVYKKLTRITHKNKKI
jgi:hypothetical protein